MTVTVRHVRVGGWCDTCGGAGRVAVEHVDVPAAVGSGDVVVVLQRVAQHVQALVAVRLGELDYGHGCEAAAGRAFEAGRLRVIERDMWEAVGLPAPGDVGVEV